MSDDAKADDPSEAPAPDDAAETDEANTEGEGGEDEGGEVQEAPKSLKDKLAGKMKFIVFGAVALVLIGGGAGLYFSGVLHTEKLHETTVSLPGPPVFYELQRITIDLKPSKGRARPFIRLSVQAELQSESAKQAFIANEIKIMDALQAHLRTVTAPELSGEQGTEQLRNDFTTIINRLIEPERAITVLYKDILVR